MLSQVEQGRSKAKVEFSLLKATNPKATGSTATVSSLTLELRATNEHYTRLFNLAPFAYLTLNDHGFIVEINRRANTLLALRGSVSNTRAFKSLVIAEDQGVFAQAEKALLETAMPQVCELRFIRRDTFFWGHLEIGVEHQNGVPVFRVAIVDITANKDAESKLKQIELQQQQSLTENTTLLREAYHRMKNNLQIISGLLRMQAEMLEDHAAGCALKECHFRVLSMALIHERLYMGGLTSEVDFADLAATLTTELFKSFGGPPRIKCKLKTRPLFLHPDQAVPCGLILNELLTNAFKYAYPEGTSGEIEVALTETASGFVKLTVVDRGVGLPHGLDWKSEKSMGLPLVDALTQQLGGKLVVGRGPGACFTLQFRRVSNKKEARLHG